MLANLGPVWLGLGTCPATERSNLSCWAGPPRAGKPGASPFESLGAKANGERGHRGGPVDRACTREKLGQNPGPEASREAQGPAQSCQASR